MKTTLMNRTAAALALAFALAGAAMLAAQETKAPADSHKRPAAAQRAEADEEHTVPEARVPAAVRNAFHRAYPSATVLKYSTEVEHGKTIYEVESRDGTTHRDLNIAVDGTILETETQVRPAALPAPVRSAAEANGAHIHLAEMVVVGADTSYEIQIQGRRGALRLHKDGTPMPPEQP